MGEGGMSKEMGGRAGWEVVSGGESAGLGGAGRGSVKIKLVVPDRRPGKLEAACS